MQRKPRTPKNVDEYLEAVPAKQRAVLQKVRKTIKATAPQAEEVISYGIPLYKYKGHLVGFAAFKNHCSFFVTHSSAMKRFENELEPYIKEKTTIHFTADQPLSNTLVKKIVRLRMAENGG